MFTELEPIITGSLDLAAKWRKQMS